MSNLYKDWAVDLAIDRAFERVEELNMDEERIAILSEEEYNKIIEEGD
jgi:hypothetical protein